MTIKEYQRKAMRTATPKCYNTANAALGLTGEAGVAAVQNYRRAGRRAVVCDFDG